MDLSRRDAFCSCSRDSSGDKGQFCFTAKENCKWNRPPYRFCMFPSAILLFQNFLSATEHRHTVLTLSTQNLQNLPLV